MYGRQDNNSGNGDSSQVPPWLVRAEVTIRHGDAVTSETVRVPPGTTTTTDTGGIRMICRWNTSEPSSTSTPIPATTSNVFPPSDCAGGFGFQRGNILFTSTPPERPSQRSGGSYTLPRSGSSGNDDSISSRGRANVSDSGYNSEQFSSQTYSSLPTRRSSQQYNRRCKSTCSIVLSTSADKTNSERVTSVESSKTPSVDYWQRRPLHQHVFSRHQFSAVPEVCEDCAEGSASSAFTTHFCTRVAEKTANSKAIAISKDAASQTTDIESARSSSTVKSSRVRRKTGTGVDQHSEQKKKEQETQSPPASVRTTSSAPPADSEKSDSSAKEDSSKRKSRTVHIDVYCTGSDDDASTDTTSEDERMSTPMTVFENEDVKVTHTQATGNLPRGFQDTSAFLKRSAERRCASFRNTPMRMPSLASSKGYDSDEVLSSLYPSRFSSYSGIRDLDSAPSIASSSTAISPCDYDSTTMTSSKDTFSDIESLINSKSGLTPCDSFEYANSSDRDRIQRMNILARTGNVNKTWRSPQIERKHLLQNRKMKEYFKKHEIGWSSGDSAEDSDGAVGWSFVSCEDKSLIKKDSIHSANKEQTEGSNAINLNSEDRHPREDRSKFATRGDYIPHSNVLRDRIGPFGSKSPSPLPSTIPSRVTSPFATSYGGRTDHIIKASKFGAVVSAFRKPGHHIGPSKNPTCSCEHCRRYFEEMRGRSSSLSELERHPAFNLHK